VTHAAVAAARGIKIAPSFLIPNSQLGTFGSVTQVGCLPPRFPMTYMYHNRLSGMCCQGVPQSCAGGPLARDGMHLC
jgi:hypothetical protein